jgi:serine/threonine-protein kinase
MVLPRRSDETVPTGTVVGEYIVREPLGIGGCAAVHVAEHRITGARVALKIMHRNFAVSAKMVARFAREVELLGALDHPGIVKIDAFGQLPDERPYYAMELLDGRTLGAFVRERGRLSPAEALEIMEALGDALEALHAAGIVHRDLNAANVFVTNGDPWAVKILDFGIAKLLRDEPGGEPFTTMGRRLGTPSAMAPEQILGLEVDIRADIYALGVLLFRMLTGRVPFRGEDLLEIEIAHLEQPPPRPSELAPVDRAVDAVVLRCLAKRAADRYPNVAALLDELRRAVGARRGAASAARAVAIRVEARLPPEADAAGDDALLDDVAAVLDAAERALLAERFELVVQTGDSLLAARQLPAIAAEADTEERRAADVAAALRDALAARPAADARVELRVLVHADAAVVEARPEGPRVAGGPILRLAAWAPEETRVERRRPSRAGS